MSDQLKMFPAPPPAKSGKMRFKIISAQCSVCGRPLRGAKSLALGVGPICRFKGRVKKLRNRGRDNQTIEMFEDKNDR